MIAPNSLHKANFNREILKHKPPTLSKITLTLPNDPYTPSKGAIASLLSHGEASVTMVKNHQIVNFHDLGDRVQKNKIRA